MLSETVDRARHYGRRAIDALASFSPVVRLASIEAVEFAISRAHSSMALAATGTITWYPPTSHRAPGAAGFRPGRMACQDFLRADDQMRFRALLSAVGSFAQGSVLLASVPPRACTCT